MRKLFGRLAVVGARTVLERAMASQGIDDVWMMGFWQIKPTAPVEQRLAYCMVVVGCEMQCTRRLCSRC
jgi:hypothetical protein